MSDSDGSRSPLRGLWKAVRGIVRLIWGVARLLGRALRGLARPGFLRRRAQGDAARLERRIGGGKVGLAAGRF